MKRFDFFRLKKGSDWGREYLSRAPLTRNGSAEIKRAYRLAHGDRVVVKLRDGNLRSGTIGLRRSSQRVGDHGHSYDVASDLPVVLFDDGTEANLEFVDIEYDPARDPTAGET